VQTLKKRLAAMRDDDGGFTLIELLVVIVIIGILSGVVLFGVSNLRDEADESACAAAEDTIRTAEEAYFTLTGEYGDTADLTDDAVDLLKSDAARHYTVEASTDGSTYTWTPIDSACPAVTT
jgi:general secretion pathway protein G